MIARATWHLLRIGHRRLTVGANVNVILEEIIDEEAADRVRAMVHELERRAHKLDNGSAVEADECHRSPERRHEAGKCAHALG